MRKMSGILGKLMTGCALLAVSLVLFARAPATGAEVGRQLVVSADFDIGADGRVTRIELLTPGVAPALEQLLAGSASKWRFEPVLVDGHPAPVRTRANIELRAEPVQDGFLMRIRGVGFGQRVEAVRLDPPRYPREALRANVEAEVQALAEYDEDGKVTGVRILSTAVAGSRGPATHWARLFEGAVKDAAKTWKLHFEPEVDGAPHEYRAAWIPVSFTIEGGRPLVPVPGRSEVPRDILDRVASTPRDGDEPFAVQTRVRLEQDVVGSTL